MIKPNRFRLYVHDTIHALHDLLNEHGEDTKEPKEDIIDEVNQVYDESEKFRDVVRIINNDEMTTEQQLGSIYALTVHYNDNLFDYNTEKDDKQLNRQ